MLAALNLRRFPTFFETFPRLSPLEACRTAIFDTRFGRTVHFQAGWSSFLMNSGGNVTNLSTNQGRDTTTHLKRVPLPASSWVLPIALDWRQRGCHESPTQGPSRVIPTLFLEPLPRSWSHFVGIYHQKWTESLKIDLY